MCSDNLTYIWIETIESTFILTATLGVKLRKHLNSVQMNEWICSMGLTKAGVSHGFRMETLSQVQLKIL